MLKLDPNYEAPRSKKSLRDLPVTLGNYELRDRYEILLKEYERVIAMLHEAHNHSDSLDRALTSYIDSSETYEKLYRKCYEANRSLSTVDQFQLNE